MLLLLLHSPSLMLRWLLTSLLCSTIPSVQHSFHFDYRVEPDRCLLCTVKGHRAKDCRNARICSTCGCLGHFTHHCHSRSSILPPKPLFVPSSSLTPIVTEVPSNYIFTCQHPLVSSCPSISTFTPSDLVSSSPVFVPDPLTSPICPSPSLLPPILATPSMAHHRVMRLMKNDNSACLKAEMANGVVLTTSTRLNTGDLLSALRICFPTKGHQWAVRSLGGTQFLVHAPDLWCARVLDHGYKKKFTYKLIRSDSSNYTLLSLLIRVHMFVVIKMQYNLSKKTKNCFFVHACFLLIGIHMF
jgi:hypothetical protein